MGQATRGLAPVAAARYTPSARARARACIAAVVAAWCGLLGHSCGRPRVERFGSRVAMGCQPSVHVGGVCGLVGQASASLCSSGKAPPAATENSHFGSAARGTVAGGPWQHDSSANSRCSLRRSLAVHALRQPVHRWRTTAYTAARQACAAALAPLDAARCTELLALIGGGGAACCRPSRCAVQADLAEPRLQLSFKVHLLRK